MKKNSFVSASTRNSTVPALSYFTATPIFTAASHSRSRTSPGRFGAGAISTTF